MVLLALACAAVLISTAVLAVVVADDARARQVVYGACLIASLTLLSIALLALLGFSMFRRPLLCRSESRGSERISVSMRFRPFSWPWSISARLQLACSRLDTVATSMPRAGCCRSTRRFSPE